MSIRVHKTESNKSTIKADKQKLVVTDTVRHLPEGKRSGGGGSEGGHMYGGGRRFGVVNTQCSVQMLYYSIAHLKAV